MPTGSYFINVIGGRLSVDLVGAEEAIAALGEFNIRTRRKQLRKALDAGAGLLRDAAVRAVAVESRTLKQSLRVASGLTQGERRAWARIGAKRGAYSEVAVTDRGKTRRVASFSRGKDGSSKVDRRFSSKLVGRPTVRRVPSRYAHLVEHGADRHTIQAKNKRVLARAGTVFGYSVSVGATAKPFLGPTSRAYGGAANAKAIAKLRGGVEFERKAALARANKRARLAAGV